MERQGFSQRDNITRFFPARFIGTGWQFPAGPGTIEINTIEIRATPFPTGGKTGDATRFQAEKPLPSDF